jgi:hypothetical protein
MKNRVINVKGGDIAIVTRQEQDYISLTDMVKNFDGGSALIEQWLKNKDTVLFLGVWEQLNNSDFNSNSPEFEGIRIEAGRNSATLEQLVVLSNLESLNAVLIHQGLEQAARLMQLNTIAISQMKSLLGNRMVKQLAQSAGALNE